MPKRKKNQVDDETHERTPRLKKNRARDLSRSIPDGVEVPTADSRLPEDEPDQNENTTNHKIPFNDKLISCERYGPPGDPALIFTHGAGGGIATPATSCFAAGFATVSPVLCFQGNMNLKSRTKFFQAVLEHEKIGPATALGGRSMGARAAVLTALAMDEKPEALVLVSWPLTTGSKGEKREPERREKILLDLPEDIDVLFVAGSEDAQCDPKLLEELRSDMAAKSWLVQVKGADHGMSLKTKDGIEAVRRMTGAIAAKWLQKRDDAKRECSIEWMQEEGSAKFEAWQHSKDGDDRESKKRKTQ